MSTDALKYFIPPGNSLWRWSEDKEAVIWNDGRTIAFREEVLHVLQSLASGGLPSLGAIVLLLAATKKSWQDIAEEGTISALLNESEDLQSKGLLPRVLDGLDRVNLLSAEHRNTLIGKSEIAQLIFEGAKNLVDPKTSEVIIKQLQNKVYITTVSEDKQPNSGINQHRRDLGYFLPGIDRVKEATLGLRQKTGLEELPKPVAFDLPEAERIRGLLKELEKDQKLCGFSKVSQQLMAAVSLPRSIADQEDDLPLGGLSDISNRGALDRLLLSELANDDLTLAVRVAMNEALYLQRESPPSRPSLQRIILLDSGIRSWGVPRIFSSSIAMAIAATSDRQTETVIFRAAGSSLEPVELSTRNGLIAHLESLHTDFHPGAALVEFQNQINSWQGETESVLITTEDVYSDPAFLKDLESGIQSAIFIVTVNREGKFTLWQRGSRGRKMIRELQVDLEQLFEKNESTELIDRDAAQGLPAIFTLERFPLLLSHSLLPEAACQIDSSASISIARDGRLTLWREHDCGAMELLSNLMVAKKFVWSYFDKLADRFYAIASNDGVKYDLFQVDLEDYCCHAIPIRTINICTTVCSHNSAIFFISKRNVEIHNMETGEQIGNLRLPLHARCENGRFFYLSDSPQPWHVLSFNGTESVLEELPVNPKFQHEFITIFEGDNGEGMGMFGITNQGEIYSFNTEKIWGTGFIPDPANVLLAVSDDKQRIAVSDRKKSGHSGFDLVDLKAHQVTPIVGDPKHWVKIKSPPNFQLNLRKRFESIYVNDQGLLTLTSRKNVELSIQYFSHLNRIGFSEAQVATSETIVKKNTFKQLQTDKSFGYTLRVANWEDGSQAFLDSRGLLHLRSSDELIPEISIVLHENHLSGWTSEGKFFGHEYFIDDNSVTDSEEIFIDVIQRFTNQIQ
ncbi:MAG: hypothetical protein MPJ24_06645 [Pirellulaceae bacterium]|nr:hypothetical protein [Pirellulaceae bacterium]